MTHRAGADFATIRRRLDESCAERGAGKAAVAEPGTEYLPSNAAAG